MAFHLRHALKDGGAVALEHLNGRGGGHLLDVGAGGEGALVTGEHDGADGRVQVEGSQGVHQLGEERVAESVEGFGAVEAHEADVGRGFRVSDVFVGWSIFPSRWLKGSPLRHKESKVLILEQ